MAQSRIYANLVGMQNLLGHIARFLDENLLLLSVIYLVGSSLEFSRTFDLVRCSHWLKIVLFS